MTRNARVTRANRIRSAALTAPPRTRRALRWRGLLARSGLGLGLLLAGTLSSPAMAAPLAESPRDDAALMARQEPLLTAADRIRTVLPSLSPPEAAGYAGISVDPEAGVLRLHWRGAPPARLRTLVRALDSAPGTRVEVRSADYSLARLEREARTLVESVPPGPGRPVSAAPRHDGSGLTVRVAGAAPASLLRTDVPVTVERGPAPRPAGRANDTVPVSGGALLITEAETCTAGFGVVHRTTGERQLLTAGHCGTLGSPWYNGDGDFIGNAVARHPENDVLAVRADGVAARVWHGAVNERLDGVGEVTRRVVRGRSPVVGQYLCVSGAVSGTHCGLRVTRVGVVMTMGGVTVTHQVEAEQVRRRGAAGNGDSGGPVYSGRGSRGPVTAHGMISAFDGKNPANCTGLPTGPRRTCSWRVYFTDIRRLLTVTGTRLATPADRPLAVAATAPPTAARG